MTRETDAWTRTLCLLAYAVHVVGGAAAVDPAWVSPGAPRELLVALRAAGDVGGDPVLAARVGGAEHLAWLADLVDSLGEWGARVAVMKGRQLVKQLAARDAAAAPKPPAEWERALAIAHNVPMEKAS